MITPYTAPIRYIAGTDISFNKFSTTVFAGIVVLSFPALQPVGYSLVKKEVTFPYVPGYLAFREVPALLDAWQLLPFKPDVLVLDGHGIAHPRRMGIAAHFGALIDHATIGCAKQKLYGRYEEPGPARGTYSPLLDKQGDVIGNVLRTKEKVKPVFISPGHRTDVVTSTDIILRCVRRHRLPEPTRLAHLAVNQFRLGQLSEGYTTISSPAT